MTADPRPVRPGPQAAAMVLAGRAERAIALPACPAFLVMGIITFYPLLFQAWMSFTDFGLEEPERQARRRTTWACSNYIEILTNDIAQHPELRLRAAAVVQPVLGIQQRHHPRGASASPIAVVLNVRRSCGFKRHLPGRLRPARRHPADHRGDGLAQHVRPAQRRDELRCSADRGCCSRSPARVKIALARRIRATRSRSSPACRSPTSRC